MGSIPVGIAICKPLEANSFRRLFYFRGQSIPQKKPIPWRLFRQSCGCPGSQAEAPELGLPIESIRLMACLEKPQARRRLREDLKNRRVGGHNIQEGEGAPSTRPRHSTWSPRSGGMVVDFMPKGSAAQRQSLCIQAIKEQPRGISLARPPPPCFFYSYFT